MNYTSYGFSMPLPSLCFFLILLVFQHRWKLIVDIKIDPLQVYDVTTHVLANRKTSNCLPVREIFNISRISSHFSLFTQSHVKDYNLRNLEGKLSLPSLNTNYLKPSFCYSGTCLWNNLPQDLKSVGSIKKVSEISDSHAAIM